MKKVMCWLIIGAFILQAVSVIAVQVIEEPQIKEQGAVEKAIGFFVSSWKWLLAAVLIFILGMVIYYLLKKIEDERRERDEPGYQVYKALKKTCSMQSNPKKIRKHWSPINLLWLGFPIIKREHSAKILDVYNRTIGYYRGEANSMDQSINFLAYKNKIFFFFEDNFILKIPLILKYKKKDKAGVEKDVVVNLQTNIQELANGDIKLYCSGLERLGLYYYCPVFIIDNEHGNLDYRKVMEGAILDNTYQAMVQRLVNVQAKMMEKATLTNPAVQAKRLGAEMTKEESKLDDNTP